MTVFADSSALVKLYSDEPGSELVHALEGLVVSDLARVEVPAALWRKHHNGELNSSDALRLTAKFEAELFGTRTAPPRFTRIGTSQTILDTAANLTATRGLRAYDAVQLATALAVRDVDPRCSQFAAFDNRLRAAAAAERLELIP